jgi:hypothetical protein
MRPFFGLGWESYVTRGSGLTPQLWSTFFLFPALAWGWAAVRGGKRGRRQAAAEVAAAALLLAACVLTHTIFGYGVALSLGIASILPGHESRCRQRLVRLFAVGAATTALTGWFAIPLAFLSNEVLRSQWEPEWKWNSIGLRAVLSEAATGKLFDGGGIPIVSFVVAAGLVAAALRVVRHRDDVARFALSGFVVGILLFAGRTTWGRLVDLLPLASGLHMHRFVALVQAFGLILAAIGLDSGVEVMRRLRERGTWQRRAAIVAVATLAVAFAIPARERAGFMARNDGMVEERSLALEQSPEVRAAIARLSELPAGRVYAGLRNDWGVRALVGDVPLYAILQQREFDMAGYPYAAMAFPAELLAHADFTRPEMLALYGVRWIVAPNGAPVPSSAVLRESFGALRLYEVPGAGYFSLGRVQDLDAPAGPRTWPEIYRAGKAWLEGPALDEHRFAAFFGRAPEPIQGEVTGSIENERIGCGRYEATVLLQTTGDLVLKVTKHPWWRSRVDGGPASITPVFPGFQSVRLSPGRHVVEFLYTPPSWKRWLFAIGTGTALLGVATIAANAARSCWSG